MQNRVSASESPVRQAKGPDQVSHQHGPQHGAPALAAGRPENATLQALQAQMDTSPGALQLRALQSQAAASPRAQRAPRRHEQAEGQRGGRANPTGLPDQLKSGIEVLSGMNMDSIRVHYNSDKPAQLAAHAYAQGTEIHLAPGQETHLPHEAWHVVQQAQGRVTPTLQMTGDVLINDDAALESEADRMGARALLAGRTAAASVPGGAPNANAQNALPALRADAVQRAGDRVVQRFALTLAVIHPVLGRSVIMNRYDDVHGIYYYHHTQAELRISYNASSDQFLDHQNRPIAAPPGFNEDAGPIARVASAQNTFRALEFETDSENRVVRARGRIYRNGTTAETGRSSDAQSGAWDHVQGIHRRMFKPLKEFNGGHIIAHHFGGSPGTDNMVPMEKKYNQSGSYKRFENALDVLLATESPLTIDVSVTYAADYNTLMGHLVTTDNGNKVAQIQGDQELHDIVMRTLGRIPSAITVNSLMNGANVDIKPANPASPMSTLRGTIARNFSLDSIRKEEFEKVGKGRDGDGSKKTFKPFEKSFGPRKRERIGKTKNYHGDYQTIYRDMPKPGITAYYPAGNGLAGGVRAYIWIDPMGAMNRHGGSDTIDSVDPAGANWNYFRKAIAGGGRNRIYKKGHLLNAGLHGPGADSRNLLPITTLANGDMSRNFEEPVKKSDALINPAKGVIWETRTSAALVSRPPGWTLHAAAGRNSGHLFNEEAKLPQFIECIAWEAIQHNGVIEQGRTIVSHRVWNKHPDDADGVLGETIAGNQANDTQIDARLPPNRNNVQGHVPVVPRAAQQGGHARGYSLDHDWLIHHIALLAEFKRGAHERGYDLGFARAGPGSQANWHPQVAFEFLEGYRKGEERFYYSNGFYTEPFVMPSGPDQRLNERYLDGRYARGKEIGKALGSAPAAPVAHDPIAQGYTDGLYERGKDDAGRRLAAAGDEANYMEGYIKQYGRSAYDNGYDLLAPPQPYATFDATVYGEAYDEGQYDRGYDDGNVLADFQTGQTQGYIEGYRDGAFDYGREDGYDGKDAASDDGDYLDGHARGIEEREFDRGHDDAYGNQAFADANTDYGAGYFSGAGERMFDDGYDLLPPTFPLEYEPFAEQYRQGEFERGREDGYHHSILPDRYSEAYIQGYTLGLEERDSEIDTSD